jgi:hypothetical protein
MSKGAKVMFGEMYGYFTLFVAMKYNTKWTFTLVLKIRVVLIFASFKFARFNFAHLVETHSLSFKFAQIIFRVRSFWFVL